MSEYVGTKRAWWVRRGTSSLTVPVFASLIRCHERHPRLAAWCRRRIAHGGRCCAYDADGRVVAVWSRGEERGQP